jgi:hypothetical protein
MDVLAHVIIALASVGVATYAWVAPSVVRVRWSYGLIAATLLSGSYLVAARPSRLMHVCVVGMLYVVVVIALTVGANRRLASQASRRR